jgi:SSS family solute:Na+ symporter
MVSHLTGFAAATHFTALDTTIVVLYSIACIAAGVWVRRYAGRLDSFIVAGRGVGVYLGVASLAATEFGLVTAMYTAQYGYTAGFAPIIIGVFYAVAMLFMGETGFIVKRLRASGAATISEVLEKKFGSDVRWWTGLIVAAAGILNMGVFLRVGGEFVVTFVGIAGGSLEVAGLRLGYLELIMTALLLVVMVYTMAGGMLSVLMTDLLQFLIVGAGVVLITILSVNHAGWSTLVDKVRAVDGDSGFNPFLSDPLGGPSGLLFWMLLTFGAQCTWQTTIARVLSAKDEKTAANIYRLAGFYFVGRWALPIVWGVLALVILDPKQFPRGDAEASRLAMPTALGLILPAGLAGFVLAAMLAAEMSTVSSYILSWATVIVHDIIKPRCSTPLSSTAELRLTRLFILLIGLFLLFFGLWYEIPGPVFEYLGLTGTIYVSGLSTLLIAALYWQRSTRTGAYLALALGASSPSAWLVYDLVRKVQPEWPKIPVHWAGLASFFLAVLGMIVGSLVSRKAKASWDSGNGFGS